MASQKVSRPGAARGATGSSSAARALARNGQPLYRQMADDLRRRIIADEFEVGESIPTEAQLSLDYRASRITVRHALDLLKQEGLLHREQGRGSFIRHRAITVGPRRLTSFSEELRTRGREETSDLISVDRVPMSSDIPIDAGSSEGVVRLERVRRADGQALAHQVTFLPSEFDVGLEEALTEKGSMYEYLRSRHAIEIDSADETYRVGPADADEASILGIPVGSPVFVVERVGFTGTRRIEWTLSTVIGDGYEVHVHLRR
jgi:GntR family transcriptional regulator